MFGHHQYFRLFVSSTFSDMIEERNALQKHVFPRLKTLCHQYGFRFQAIDLRWGVGEEAALDQRTMEICLQELSRCREYAPPPNFLMLLGDRYGWRPLPWCLTLDEFQHLDQHADARERALLNHWYRRDDNACPPVHFLRPRRGEYVESKVWEDVERRLRHLLDREVRHLSLTPKRRIQWVSSATEQEIQFDDFMLKNQKWTHAFIRTIEGLPAEESTRHYRDFNSDGTVNHDAWEQQKRLQEQLRHKLGECAHDFTAHWTGEGITLDHIPALCERVYQTYSSAIQEIFQTREKILVQTGDEDEHLQFAKERSQFFTGRNRILQQLSTLQKRGEGTLGILHGLSGSGKSALLAHLLLTWQKQYPQGIVLGRFIGITPASSSVSALLADLVNRLSQPLGRIPPKPAESSYEQVELFMETLRGATKERPIYLILDGLDQLVGEGRSLEWFPSQLPDHVCLVTSILSDQMPIGFEDRLSHHPFIPLNRLSQDQGHALLDAWLAHHQRTLQPDQKKAALAAFWHTGLPLHLQLIYQEVKTWRSDEPIPPLPENSPVAFGVLLGRLAVEHGPTLLRRSLGYLIASRDGLTEDEWLDLLDRDEVIMEEVMRLAHHPLPEPRLPVVIFSRLAADLAPFLTDKALHGTRIMTFFHRGFAEAVRDWVCHVEPLSDYHERMVRYYGEQPDTNDYLGLDLPNSRKTLVLPHHLHGAGQIKALLLLLTDLSFPLVKCAAGQIQDLLHHDYELVSGDWEKNAELNIWKLFFRRTLHLLLRNLPEWPSYKTLLQLAMEQADESPVNRSATRWLEAGNGHWFWLRQVKRPNHWEEEHCLYQLEGHSDLVVGLIELSTRNLVSWSQSTLCFWQPDKTTPVTVVSSGLKRVTGVQELSNGNLLCWDGEGEVIQIWSPEGRVMVRLTGHEGKINGVMEMPDGSLLSWSKDATLRLWNAQTGGCRAVMTGHTTSVVDAFLLPDGEILSSCDSNKGEWYSGLSDPLPVRRWSGQTGEPRGESTAHGLFCDDRKAHIILTDGHIVSWGHLNDFLILWNVEEDRVVAKLAGHTDRIVGVVSFANGNLLSWAERGDNLMRLWSSRSGQCLGTVSGGDGPSRMVLEISGNRFLTWSGHSQEPLQIRSCETGAVLTTFKTLTGVEKVLALADSRLLVANGDGRLWRIDPKPGSDPIGIPGIEKGHHWLQRTDGHVCAWGSNHAIRVWDISQDFMGDKHAVSSVRQPVKSVTFLATGRVFTTLEPQGVALWSKQTGDCLTKMAEADFFLELNDRSILVWSESPRLMMERWSGESGECLMRFTGHTAPILGVRTLKNGTILSWSEDQTLRLWSPNSATPKITWNLDCQQVQDAFERADGSILTILARKSISETKDRLDLSEEHERLAVWSPDHPDGPVAVLKGHPQWRENRDIFDRRWIHCDHTRLRMRWWACGYVPDDKGSPIELSNGHILSWGSYEGHSGLGFCSLRLWSPQKKGLVALLTGHTRPVIHARELKNGNIISVAKDRTIRQWSGLTGALIATFEGHESPIEALLELADGDLVSASQDGVLRIWSTDPNTPPVVLFGHGEYVAGMVEWTTHFLISWSKSAVCIWSRREGRLLRKFAFVADGVIPFSQRQACAWNLDRLIVWSQDPFVMEAQFPLAGLGEYWPQLLCWLKQKGAAGDPYAQRLHGLISQRHDFQMPYRASFRSAPPRIVLDAPFADPGKAISPVYWHGEDEGMIARLGDDGDIIAVTPESNHRESGSLSFLALYRGARQVALSWLGANANRSLSSPLTLPTHLPRLDKPHSASWLAILGTIQALEQMTVKGQEGESLLYWATINNRSDVINPLLDRENPSQKTLEDLLKEACSLGFVEMADMLLSRLKSVFLIDLKEMLMTALDHRHFEVAELLLKHGVRVSEISTDGSDEEKIPEEDIYQTEKRFLMKEALLQGDTHVVRFFLEQGYDVNCQDESGLAPLHLAVYGGYRDMCELLVRHGADLNRKTREEGITPLYMIINKKGDFRAMARWLVEQGADLESRTNRGSTLLFEAIHERDPELVSLFLQQGARTDVTDEKGWLPLHVVANDGDWPLAAHLLDHGAEINAKCQKEGFTPLIMATGQENVEMVWGLVSRGADLYATSTTGETPLHRAASCGMAGVVDFLVHCGAHVEAVDMKGRTPLHLAALAGHETTIQVLLAYVLKRENGWTGSEREEEMSITGWTLFHALALEGNAEILSALSEKSCSVTDRDSLGRTALYLAAEHNHLGVIEAFVKIYGAFLMEMADEEGCRPIHRACQLGHLEVVKRLIELGADPAATHRVREEDIDGVTALHDAAKNNHVAMVKELVNHCPCLLTTTDDRGWTPLHYAARFDSTEVAKTLIELGADPRAVDQIGNSPVDYLDDRKKKNGLDILFPNMDSATCFETSDDLFVYFQPRVLDLIARLSTLLEDLTGTPYLLHLREIRVFQEKEGPESLFDQDRCLIHVKGSRGQDLGEIYVVVNLTPAIVLSGRIMMTNESVIRRHVENRMVGKELEESFQELGHQIVGALNDWIGKQAVTGGMLTLEAIGCVDQHPPMLINGSSHLLVTVAIEIPDYPPEYFRLLFSKGWTASLFPGNMWHWFR